MVDLPSQPLADIDPEFEAMALETGEFTYHLHGTSVREKLLQNLANDVCRGHLGLAFELHVTAAHQHDVSYADLLALLRFVAPYAGYPAAADALGRLREVATTIDMDTAAAPPELSTKEALTVGSADPWLSIFVGSRLGRAWAEERLTDRERAIVALTADVATQSLGESFRGNVQLALDMGLTKHDVRDAVRFCAEMSVARTAAALRELDRVLR